MGEAFYAKARRLVMDNMDKLDESPHLDFVHGLFSLATFSISSGRGSAGWMYISMAIRISIFMNLNIDPDFLPLKLSWIEKEQRRRTWWTCYATDKMMSIYCNRPQSITAPSNVKPPVSGRVWEYIRRDTGSPNPPSNVVDSVSANTFQDPVFACVKLLGILHKIWEASAFFKTATEDLNQIQGPIFEGFQKYKQQIPGLQTELTDWFNALPPWISNPGTIFFPEIQSENPPSYHAAYALILYHTARVILHRPLMMKIAKLCPRATRSSFHWQQCTDAANQVSSLLSVMLSDNPCLHHCNPFIIFCIYQTSLVHILNTQLAQCIKEEDGPEMVWPEHVLDMGAVPKFACNIEKDETINIWWEKSVMSLMVHIQAMNGMAILWYPARKYLCIWKKLVLLAKLEKWVPVRFPGEIEITEKEMEDQVVENDTAVLPNGFEPEAVEIKRKEAEFQTKLLQQHQDQWRILSSTTATEPAHTHNYVLPRTVVPVVSSVYDAMSRPNYFDINFNQVSDFTNNQNYMIAMEPLGLNSTTSFISPNMYEKLQTNAFTNVPMSTSSLVTPTATPTPFTIQQPELKLWEQFQEVYSNYSNI
ncbi:hypothetical protein HK098_002336 [Nowakowskiella sp. JEL0407]|nr:hypothetical protein HK098_002336 [Nowakowskiella sp. JEL0407]